MNSEQPARTPTRILLIQNTDNRLEEFRPMFEDLHARHYGKLSSGHFAINTRFKFSGPLTRTRLAFNMLQITAEQWGYNLNCFCFNI